MKYIAEVGGAGWRKQCMQANIGQCGCLGEKWHLCKVDWVVLPYQSLRALFTKMDCTHNPAEHLPRTGFSTKIYLCPGQNLKLGRKTEAQ